MHEDSHSPKTPAYDIERRRRFLKLAAGGLGAFGLAGSQLAHALPRLDDPIGGDPTCTTTVTFSNTSSSSTTHPSGASRSFSGTELCTGDGSTSKTFANSFSRIHQWIGGGETFSYTGRATHYWGQPGTDTISESCSDGTGSYTYSYPSYPAFTESYSSTESGTMTATCEDNMPGGPESRDVEVGTGSIEGTRQYDSSGEILVAGSRRRHELLLDGLFDELRELEKELEPHYRKN